MSRCPCHPLGYHYFVFFGLEEETWREITVCIDCGQHLEDAEKEGDGHANP